MLEMLEIFQKIGILLLMSGWKKLNKEILIDTLEDYEILHVRKVELQSQKDNYV